jgi:hypothetical protein
MLRRCYVLLFPLLFSLLGGCTNGQNPEIQRQKILISKLQKENDSLKAVLASSNQNSRVGEQLSVEQLSSSKENESLLELKSMIFERETETVLQLSGQVKNISNEKLSDIWVVITYYDINGDFIVSDSHDLDFNPILKGQTSAFHVLSTYNPAMYKAEINFQFLGGAIIPFKSKRKTALIRL